VKQLAFVLALALLVSGCATTPTPTPVAVAPTLAPTWTPQPTYTPNPTYTPYPTPTYVPPTATPAPTSTPAPTATPTPVTYVVQPGDALNVLAQRLNVSPDAIIAANNITNPDIIEVGSVLIIPLTNTATLTATGNVTPTVQPVVVRRVVQPPAPASNMVYPAPQILYPDNGLTLKYDPNDKHGGVDSITFAWLPVSYNLESGKTSCHWETQPNGTTAFLWDRYQIEVNPPLHNVRLNMTLNIFHNDQGTNRIFSLLEFNPGVSYTWRVAVGRWCVTKDYDNQDPKHQGFLGLVSPYTAPRTFMYTQ
jgi:LysM repeat protein